MPSASRARGGRSRTIKEEHEPTYSATVANSAVMKNGTITTSAVSPRTGDAHVLHFERSSIDRENRSHAPPPSSEHPTESERPLLREVRPRQEPVIPESPVMPEESFLNNSFQDIGKSLKDCNDTLGELQQLGVSHKVKLPELVLVGDQSAGKSTLMSGLANLELPRSDGTCTRCPLHIRVSRRAEWSCRVSLRRDYVYKPPEDREIRDSDVTNEDPFFPWKKLQNTQLIEFKTMQEQGQIEEVLRWAQVAILNDDQAHERFVPGSGGIANSIDVSEAAEHTTAKFSPNIVALEIMGPQLPDLSFYDMPGIFHNPGDARDDYLVSVVRNLSSEYIRHPTAIILCGVAMNADAENSYSLNLIRKLGASNRTIGVLTKADLLPVGPGQDQWLKILNGEAHQLGLGYFITSRKPDMLLEELSRWEEQFFDCTRSEAWPRSFQPFDDRCGIERLKAYLSERLAQEFARSLPNIKKTVRAHLEKVDRELANLPEMPENVESAVRVSLCNFSDNARGNIEEYRNHYNDLPNRFRDCLLAMKPKFVLKDKSDIPVLEISDDESDGGSVASQMNTPSKRRTTNGRSGGLPKRPRLDATNGNNGGSFSQPSPVKNEEDRPNMPVAMPLQRRPDPQELPAPFQDFSRIGSGFSNLAEVRREKLKKTRGGMPGQVLSKLYEELAMKATKPWSGPAKVVLKETIIELQRELDKAAANSFEELKKRLVFQEVKKLIRACLREHGQLIEKAIEQLYEDETNTLLTFNNDTFAQYLKEELAILMHFRHFQRMQHYGSAGERLIQWDQLNDEKRSTAVKRREAEISKIGPDPFQEELGVIAYVRAYYKVAALRFADAVSQCIVCRLLPAIRRELSTFIDERLGLRDGNPRPVYEMLMEEDAKTAEKRRNAKLEREKFVKALASITALESGVTDNDDEDGDTEMTLNDHGEV